MQVVSGKPLNHKIENRRAMRFHYFVTKNIWTAFKNTIIFLLSSSKSRGKCFPQFYLNKTFRVKWKGTLDRSWSTLSTCNCSSLRCLGDVYIHATDTYLQASLAGECFSLAALTASRSCMDTTCAAHHCKRGQKPLNQRIWNLTRTEEEGRKDSGRNNSCENSCKTLLLRGQGGGNPCYLLVCLLNMFVYLYSLPQKLPVEKSTEPPGRETLPKTVTFCSRGGNTVLTHSLTGTQAAAPETSVLSNFSITSITWPPAEQAQIEGGKGLVLLCFLLKTA